MSTSRLLSPLLLVTACVAPPSDPRSHVDEDVEARLGTPVGLEGDRSAARIERMLGDGELGADEAVRIGIACNPELQALLADLDIARAELWAAALPPNPVLDAEVQFIEGDGGHLIELSVAQNIIDLLLLPRRRQIAGARLEQVRARSTAAVLDLAAEIRTTYRELQAQVELIELYRTATDATYFSYDAARRLHDAGNIIELDVLTEQALYEDAKLEMVAAQVMARKQRENLNTLMGIWGPAGESWDVEGRLPVPAPLGPDLASEFEARVLEKSLDLEAMRQEILALGHTTGLEKLEVTFPDLAGGLTGEREADGTWSGGPFASIPLPVFDFGQAAGAKGEARVRQAYERYTDLAIRIRHSARSAYVQSEATGNSSRYLLETVVPLRSRITQRTQEQFNAMQVGVFQVLDSRRRELGAGRRYVESLRDHWVARTYLESLLLGRLPRTRFGISTPDSGGTRAMAGSNETGGH